METVIIIVVILLFLAAFMLIRTARAMRPLSEIEESDLVEVDVDGAAKRLSDVIQLETVSSDHATFNHDPFKKITQKIGRNVSSGSSKVETRNH